MKANIFPGSDRSQRRTLFVLLAVVVLAVMALSAYQLWSSYRETVDEAETKTRNYAAIIEARLDAALRRTDATLLEQVRAIPVAALSRQALPHYAGNLDAEMDFRLSNFPELISLRVFDAEGELLYTSDRESTRRANIGDRSHFRQLRDQPHVGLVFSEVVISRITGQRGVFIGRALKDGQGVFRGAVYAGLDLEHFQKLFQSLVLGARSVIAIHSSDNFRPVVRWPMVQAKLGVPLPPGTPVRAAVTAGSMTGTIEFSSATDGTVRTYSFHVLDRYPFFVTAGVAREDALAGWRVRALAVGLSGLLLAGLLGVLLYRLLRAQGQQARMLAELGASEARFQTLLQAAPEPIIVHVDGRLVYANPAALQLFGMRDLDEILGKHALSIVHPDSLDHVRERLAKHLRGEPVQSRVEQRWIRVDGSSVEVEVTSVPFLLDGKAAVHVMGRDITERRRLETALQAQTERLLIGQRTARMIIMDWDVANDQISWSDSPDWLRGPLPESGKYPPYVEQVHPEDRAGFLSARAEAIASLRPQGQEYRITRTDGRMLWVHSERVVFPGADGKAARMLGAILDVTGRKQAEEEIRRLNDKLEQKVRERTRELELSNEELRAFSYSVAHDLRTPLRGINGFGAILASEYADKLDAKALGYLQRIQAASVRMGEVMDDLLALAHAGRSVLQRQDVDLSAMAQAVAESLQSADPQRRVEFVIAPGLNVYADPGLMRVALDNLFGNAWKFSANTKSARIEFGGIPSEGEPAYFVRDNGVGFDPAFSSKLFEQFQRLHTDQEYEGTGVGLAIVARVIRRHGGRIWAEGALGGGAAFYFTLA